MERILHPSAAAGGAFGFTPRAYIALVIAWTRRDFDARYRRSALSALWALLQPLAVVGVYSFIFGVIFKQTGGDLPYLSYLLAGMVIFRVVANSISLNTCLSDNYAVISHSTFPREIIPLSQVLGTTLELVVMVPALMVVARLQGLPITPTVVVAPVLLASMVIFSAGVCVVASTVQVFVRDLQFVATLLVQALFFASPISYELDQAPEWMQSLQVFNPISVNAEAFRDVALRGIWPSWGLVSVHLLLAIALLGGAVAHLRSVGHRIIDLA